MRKIIVFLTVLLLAVSLGAAASDGTQQSDDRKQVNINEDEKHNVASDSVKESIEGVGKKKVKKDKVTTFIFDLDGDNTPIIKGSALAMEGKVKFFNEEKRYASIKDKESDEEYFVHATGHIDEIRDEDDVSSELREGRKGMNAVDVRRAD